MISLERLGERDGWKCHYCDIPLTRAGREGSVEIDVDRWATLPGWEFATRDHVWPTSLGGSNRAENLVLACGPCNIAKSNKVEEQTA